MKQRYIAQLNIAQAQDAMDSATMKGFVDRLDEINSLAESSAEFVWRLKTDEGDATIKAFDDPMLIINMSVWENFESLKNYVYKSTHVELIRDRSAWFHKMVKAHQVLWSIPIGRLPTVEEGKAKLQHLQEHGPSELAFTFAKPFFEKSNRIIA